VTVRKRLPPSRKTIGQQTYPVEDRVNPSCSYRATERANEMCPHDRREFFRHGRGRFPYKSFKGAEYQLIMFCVDANYIYCETMTLRSGKEYARAYQACINFFMERGML
jgi:hypothetical protein